MNSLNVGSRKLINRILRSGLIGDIGHISCLNNRPSVPGTTRQESCVEELTLRAANQLVEIAELMKLPATEAFARIEQDRSGTSAHVFLMLGEKTGVHFSASNQGRVDEHELWLEGSKGSIRTNGRVVWWRKRGWPVFFPISFPFSISRNKGSADENAVGNLVSAIAESCTNNVAVPITDSTAGADK